jgi:hypothetical protein
VGNDAVKYARLGEPNCCRVSLSAGSLSRIVANTHRSIVIYHLHINPMLFDELHSGRASGSEIASEGKESDLDEEGICRQA